MSEKDGTEEVNEAQIAVHWQEEDYYYPSEEFKAQANVNDKSIYDRFSLGLGCCPLLIVSVLC